MKNNSIKINAFLNMIKTVFGIIFPLITFPYVSRVLQPENIGKINFGSAFVSYFTLIASLGISTYAIRECSSKRENKTELSNVASQIFSINICTTAISYILMFIILIFFRDFDSYRTLIIIQSTAILFTTLGCDWINTAMEDFKFITIRTISFQILSLILMFIFIHNPSDYIKYAIITVISSSGANIVNIFYIKKFCNIKFTKKMDFKIHFKPIVLLFVMILAQTIFNNADITMIGLMKGDTEVAYYSTAYKVSNIIAQVVTSLAFVIMPRMSNYFANKDYEKINDLLKKVFGILVFIGLPCIAGVLGLSNEIILLVSGEKYLGAVIPLMILMFSFGFSLVGGSFLGNMVLLPSKKEKEYMIICIVATAVNFILNFFFIPMYGAIAASATTAFCSLLIAILMIKYKDKEIKLNYVFKQSFSPLIGSILIVVYCKIILKLISNFYLKTLISIAGSIVVYVIVSAILKNEILTELTNKILAKLKKVKSQEG